MPKVEETQIVVELTQHTVRALRAANGTVEAGGECALEDKPALEALLDAVAPARKTEGFSAAALLWPGASSWHLSTDTEALLDRSDESFRSVASGLQTDPRAPIAYATCNAGDGGKVTPDGTERWLLTASSRESMERSRKAFTDLKVVADGICVSAFATVGAVSKALRAGGAGGAVALWDPGWGQSHLLLVSAAGAEAAVPCSVGMDAIFEAVQSTLRLKFRGAGARLFFNGAYDFTESGPKIAAIVSAGLKEALGKLPASASPPALACLGLTGRQSWFVREVSAAAGIPHWEPGLGKLAAEMGLKFAGAPVEASFSLSSLGLLHLVSGRMGGREDWIAPWGEAEAPPEAETAAPALIEEEPEPVAEPVVKPVAPPPTRPKPMLSLDTQASAAPGAPKPVRPTVPPRSVATPPIPAPGPQAQGTRATLPPLQARPMAPPPAMSTSFSAPKGTHPSFPAPYAAPPPSFPAPAPGAPAAFPATPRSSQPSFPAPHSAAPPSYVPPAPDAPPHFPAPAPSARPPSFSNPGFAVPEAPLPEPGQAATPVGRGPKMAIGGTMPPTPVTALPFEAVSRLKPVAKEAAEGPAHPKSKVGFYVWLLVAAGLVFAAIAVVLEARMERAKAYDLEQQEQLAHHIAEQRLKEAEQVAKEEAERSRKELETAIETTKKKTEEETRRRVMEEQEAQRLAKLPGSLVVATSPDGAAVSIDGAAPLRSPVKAEGIAPGSHQVQISLAGFEPVQTTVEVKGGTVADLGAIKLQTIYGALELASSPDGLEFAIRAAADPAGKPVRTGRTPATIDDFIHGDYVVTFSRPGCRDHASKVTVVTGAKARAETQYVDGSLELTSDPSGASVSKDDSFLGTTPLVIHDLTPKVASFALTLPGYDSTPVSCEIPEGQTLKFSAHLLRRDRVFTTIEVKTPPASYSAPAPVLSASQRKTGGEVVLSLVVRRDGSVADVEIVRSTDDDIARRCKQAVEKWLFRAATAPDDRTVDARIELPFNFPASPQ